MGKSRRYYLGSASRRHGYDRTPFASTVAKKEMSLRSMIVAGGLKRKGV